MTEVRWRNNQVISIETKRKDESRETRVYVLAQMIGKAELLFSTYLILITIGVM